MDQNEQSTVPAVLIGLANRLGTEVKNWRVDIPEKFGNGYCTGFVFNEFIRLMIFDYQLREDITINSPDVDTAGRMILFKFQHVIRSRNVPSDLQIPSVLIVTSRLNPNLIIPIQRNRAMINVEVDAAYLKGLLNSSQKSSVLQNLLDNTQPLFFEEIIFPALQVIVDELVNETVGDTFDLFFRRVKTEELICRLLMALEKRDSNKLFALNGQDVQSVYRVKEQMLAQPGVPPMISELAKSAQMSPTKLKRLFRQIFGDSIFSYYQAFRMNEAARLLKAEKLSVSEVGYQLGFANLSHFTRVFEKHIGVKPKKFSSAQG